jgi:hypothetical protein
MIIFQDTVNWNEVEKIRFRKFISIDKSIALYCTFYNAKNDIFFLAKQLIELLEVNFTRSQVKLLQCSIYDCKDMKEDLYLRISII